MKPRGSGQGNGNGNGVAEDIELLHCAHDWPYLTEAAALLQGGVHICNLLVCHRRTDPFHDGLPAMGHSGQTRPFRLSVCIRNLSHHILGVPQMLERQFESSNEHEGEAGVAFARRRSLLFYLWAAPG